VTDADGRDLRGSGWVRAQTLARRRIFLYHYSLLFPRQVSNKHRYYSALFGHRTNWAQSYDTLQNPYRVHNVERYPSWLERYTGAHPPQVRSMWRDLLNGQHGQSFPIRHTEDIERLDATLSYRSGRMLLRLIGPLVYYSRWAAVQMAVRSPAPLKLGVKRLLREIRSVAAPRSRV
jgi:hypothetical protein